MRLQHVSARGIRPRLVGAHAAVRDIVRADGLDARVGRVRRSVTLPGVIDEFVSAENLG